MPNWATNVVRIYVPSIMDGFADKIIAALRGSGGLVDEREVAESDINHFDFYRIKPMPKCLRNTESGAMSIKIEPLLAAWQKSYPVGERNSSEAQKAATAIVETAVQTNPQLAAEIQKVLACLTETGFSNWYDWADANWNTKWNSCDSSEPEICEGDNFTANSDCTTLTYRFNTAWSEPTGVIEQVIGVCERYNLGLRWWVSYEDGGSKYNPLTDDYETVYEEVEGFNMPDPDDGLPLSDLMLLIDGGIDFSKRDVQDEFDTPMEQAA